MTNDHNRTRERTLGAYYTPKLTVKYIVEKTLPYIKKDSKILDLAAGDGVFLREFIKNKVNSNQLYAYDIDHLAINELKKITTNVFQKDSLTELEGSYDIIIGNPPYSSNECNYIKKNRALLKKEYYPIPPSNLYSLFCVSAIRHLKEGGIMSIIVLDSFVSNVYYKPFREFLLNKCKIKEILLAPRKLFYSVDANVRTAILTVEKCSGFDKIKERNENIVRLIDRTETEEEYFNPKKIQEVKQEYFLDLPDSTFFVNVPKNIIELIRKSNKRLGDVLSGGTGISTGNDKQFLKPAKEVKGNPEWVGYYKNGIRRAYYYEPGMFIEKDYKKHSSKIKNYMLRNEQFFFKEGITCASVGVGFSASYLPAGNLFGVNANFFAKNKTELFYALGLLNSKVVRYMLKAVLNRTNNISSKYIKKLPYLEPSAKEKEKIANEIEDIVNKLKLNSEYDFSKQQNMFDEYFFNIYGVSDNDRKLIEDFSGDIYNKL